MQAVDDALYALIVGDTGTGGVMTFYTAGLSKMVAEESTGFPNLIMQCVSAPHDYTLGGSDIVKLEYLFKGYDQGLNWKTIKDGMTRLRTLLNDTRLTIAGCRHLYTRQTFGPYDIEEEEKGVLYPVTISRFGVWVQPTG